MRKDGSYSVSLAAAASSEAMIWRRRLADETPKVLCSMKNGCGDKGQRSREDASVEMMQRGKKCQVKETKKRSE